MRPPALLTKFLILSLFLLSLNVFNVDAKTVAVVYDDSRSMAAGDKIQYASYSLQLMRAFMQDSDTLIVVTMSQFKDSSFSSSGNSRNDMKKLLELSRQAKAETPYAAVKTAIKALADAHDPDRWLVVITDGDFAWRGPLGATIANDLKSIPGLKSVLLGIAVSGKNSDDWSKGGAETFSASSAAEITENMQKIAAMVTSGSSGGGVSFDMSRSGSDPLVSFIPAFPLKRFTLLHQTAAQNDLASLKGVSVAGKSLAVSREPLDARAPDDNRKRMWGRVLHASPSDKGGLIPAGTPIVIRFDKAVSEKGFTILPEVALDQVVALFDANGNELQPDAHKWYSLCAGDRVKVVSRLVLPKGTAPPPAIKDVSVQFTYMGARTQLIFEPSSNSFTGVVTIVKGDNPISTKAEYPGYIHLLDNGYIKGRDDCKPRKFALVSSRAGEKVTRWSADVCDLCDDKESPLELHIEVDGKKLTPSEAKDWQVTLGPDSDLRMQIKPFQNGQGWTLIPETRFGSPCLTSTGTYLLKTLMNGKASPDGATGEKTIHLTLTGQGLEPRDRVIPCSVVLDIQNPGWFTRCKLFILKLLLCLLFLWWLVGVIRKPRFARKSQIDYERTGPGAKRDYVYLPGGFFSRWLVPYLPEKKTVESITFIATGSPSAILVSHKTIRHMGENLLFNGHRVKPNSDRIEQDQKINTTTRMESRSGRSQTTYKYVRPSGAVNRNRR